MDVLVKPGRDLAARPRTEVTRRAARPRRWPARVPLHLTLALICAIWLVPLAGLLVSSFRPPYAISTTGWWAAFATPGDFNLDNYVTVLTQNHLAQAFGNSLLITLPAVSLMTTFGSVAAFVFARMRFAGRRLAFTLVLALLVVPMQLALAPVLRLYNVTHLAGTFTGVWLVHCGFALPFAIYLLRGFLASLPGELFEAAEMDGASPVQLFVRIALPLSRPALASFAIFQFLWVWNDLLVALIFLGGNPEVAPLTVAVSNLVNANTGQGWQLLTAAAFVSMVCPLLIFLTLQRYFVRGLLAGAVK
ncbi:carbohydrate ABC transporter permease [Dactylosporangium sp. CS-047395]|uniref:carbohydrate ABC transporter permease n=1 Tax=Dactylosporangium sp. CS-047395 TaxID=3239936 RepID=UPI003D8E1D62